MTRNIRPIRVEGNLAYITLTHGYEAIIDAEDVSLVEAYNWHSHIQSNSVYVRTRMKIEGRAKNVSLAKVLKTIPEGHEIHWLDGDKLNNRKSNLSSRPRFSAQREVRRSVNSSGYTGVFWSACHDKWVSQILLGKTRKRLGTFDTPEEAYWAYCRALENYNKIL